MDPEWSHRHLIAMLLCGRNEGEGKTDSEIETENTPVSHLSQSVITDKRKDYYSE